MIIITVSLDKEQDNFCFLLISRLHYLCLYLAYCKHYHLLPEHLISTPFLVRFLLLNLQLCDLSLNSYLVKALPRMQYIYIFKVKWKTVSKIIDDSTFKIITRQFTPSHFIIKTQRSNLVCITYLWNDLHQVHSVNRLES